MKSYLNTRIVIAVAVTLFFWASAFTAIRVGLESYTPGHMALFRFLVASGVLAVCAIFIRLRLPERNDLPALVLMGFLGVTVYHLALNYGEVSVTAGAASFLISTAPVFTALLAVVFLGERLQVWGWAGIALSFAGVTLIALGKGNGLEFDPYALLIVLSAISASVYAILQKHYLKKYSALEITTYTVWIGTLFLLIFLPGLREIVQAAPRNATLAVIYTGIFPAAVAYVAWAYVIAAMPASIAVSFLYLMPALAVAVAWLWLGEVPTRFSLGGGFLSLLGVVLVNTRGR